MPALVPTATPAEQGFIAVDVPTMLAQIGRMNVLATSGGRVTRRETGVTLPVSQGYSVTVDLHASDTYTVRRVLKRGAKTFLKGEQTLVYCEELGEVVYRAGCYRNVAFGEHDPNA